MGHRAEAMAHRPVCRSNPATSSAHLFLRLHLRPLASLEARGAQSEQEVRPRLTRLRLSLSIADVPGVIGIFAYPSIPLDAGVQVGALCSALTVGVGGRGEAGR